MCNNRLSIRAKVVDPLLLSGLQQRLQSSDTMVYLTEAVSAKVAAALDAGPRQRRQLESAREKAQRKLGNLVVAIEAGCGSSAILQQVREREAEIADLDRALVVEPQRLEHKLTVLPSWVAQQVADVSGLLHDEPDRARAHFRRLGLRFTVTPVYEAERPFLRAVGSAESPAGDCSSRELDFPAIRPLSPSIDTVKLSSPAS